MFKKINPTQKLKNQLLTKILPQRGFLEKAGLGFLLEWLKLLGLYQPIQQVSQKLKREFFSYSPLDPWVWRELKKKFLKDICLLEELIQRDLSVRK